MAIRYAGELFPGRDALVLSVSALAKDEVSLDPISDLVGRFSGMYADWDEAFAELAGRQGRRGCELATEAGLLARPLAASGKPAPTILRTADEHDACAIVLGSGAHNRLGSPVGSVVARVVHGANRPVLVVPVCETAAVRAGRGLSIAPLGVTDFGYMWPVRGAMLPEAIDRAVILNPLCALGG